MQTLHLEYHAAASAAARAHVGVVGSGDLEILFEPAETKRASVRVRTTVDGFDIVWRRVLEAFFVHHPVAGHYELNDFGATPGVVSLRLLQVHAAAESSDHKADGSPGHEADGKEAGND
jgi:malonate decarboxylase delta subunit